MATLKSLQTLTDAWLIAPERVDALMPVAARYAVAVTESMLDLIDRADPHDPIARQFVPSEAELCTTPEERADPIGDEVAFARARASSTVTKIACYSSSLPLVRSTAVSVFAAR